MTDHPDAHVDLLDDEFERLGKRAGAELRQPPPTDGPGTVLRTAHRRRATIAAIAAGATISMVVAVLFVANSRSQDEPAPIATVPPTLSPVPPTLALVPPPDLEDATPPDAARLTTPGTWRTVADPSAFAPAFPTAAVWTGTDVIVIGASPIDTSTLSPPLGAAYDVSQDTWRRLAEPPPELDQGSSMKWTGSEVLAATSRGEVYRYDPVADRWESRAAADESMALPASGVLVAVSARGVLARSSKGWWWYENSTDRWESVPAPPDGGGYSTLVALDDDRIVAARVEGSTLTAAVFEIASRGWRMGPSVDGVPVSNRDNHGTACDANDGLLVCWAEGFSSLDGVVIDPLIGRRGTFALGNHSNTLTTKGLPWMTHAWKLLVPRTATWEDLPSTPFGSDESFSAAVWTGSEIVFLGERNSVSAGGPLGWAAAYTPLQLPSG
jgi:hypothetical protein